MKVDRSSDSREMRILILGGNGRTGELVISEAIHRGHTVTALVRKPKSLTKRSGLVVITGTPLSKLDMEAAFSSDPCGPPQAIIVTLNASRASDSPFAKPVAPPFMMRDAVRNASRVMKNYGVRRIVIMSAFGAGNSFAQVA